MENQGLKICNGMSGCINLLSFDSASEHSVNGKGLLGWDGASWSCLRIFACLSVCWLEIVTSFGMVLPSLFGCCDLPEMKAGQGVFLEQNVKILLSSPPQHPPPAGWSVNCRSKRARVTVLERVLQKLARAVRVWAVTLDAPTKHAGDSWATGHQPNTC